MKKILLLLLVSAAAFGQNKLDKSKNELRAEPKKSNTTQQQSGGKTAHPGVQSLFLEITGYVFLGAFKYGLIGDYGNEQHLSNNLTPYPFYDKVSGNFETPGEMDSVAKKKIRFDLENSFIYSNNDVYGNHLKAKVRVFQYVHLQSDFHQLFEKNGIDQSQSRLSLFQFNLNYDRIRFEKCNFGWNIGATYVGNEVKKAGFSYGLNAEYFMGNAISFYGAAKWSRINSLPVNAFELRGRFHRKNYFFTLGFERLKIATPNYNFIALGGGIYF